MVDAMYEIPSDPVEKFVVDAEYAARKLAEAHFADTVPVD